MSLSLIALLAAASSCGWLGLEIAPPEIVVREASVTLAEPLRIARVTPGSPGAGAGLTEGLEILAIDGERWDEGRFVSALVRLNTLEEGVSPRLRIRDGAAERDVRVRAAKCDMEQTVERARLLASLGMMEGTALARTGEAEALRQSLTAAEREEVERAEAAYLAGIEEFERRRAEPEVRRRIEEAMAEAERAEYLRAGSVADEDVLADATRAVRDAERAERMLAERLTEKERQVHLERAMREAEEAQRLLAQEMDLESEARFDEAMRAAEEAQRLQAERTFDDEARARYEHALQEALESRRILEERMENPEVHRKLAQARAEYEDARRRLEEEGGDPGARDRLMAAERDLERTRQLLEEQMHDPEVMRRLEAARRAADEARVQLGDGAARESIRRGIEVLQTQLEAERAASGDPERLQQIERQLALALEEMERSRTRLADVERFQAERTHAEVRRALELAAASGEERRRALALASRAAERHRRTADYLGGAEFQVVGRALAGYVGVDHGLLVAELDSDSPLARAGVEEGDVLVAIDGGRVEEIGDLFEGILECAEAEGGEVELELQNRSGRRTVRLPVGVGPI